MKSKNETKAATHEVFVLYWKSEESGKNNLYALNGRLSAGWQIKSSTPMGVVGQDQLTACCAFYLVKE